VLVGVLVGLGVGVDVGVGVCVGVLVGAGVWVGRGVWVGGVVAVGGGVSVVAGSAGTHPPISTMVRHMTLNTVLSVVLLFDIRHPPMSWNVPIMVHLAISVKHLSANGRCLGVVICGTEAWTRRGVCDRMNVK
jgi:hypothetical protein